MLRRRGAQKFFLFLPEKNNAHFWNFLQCALLVFALLLCCLAAGAAFYWQIIPLAPLL
jgi:hypothetical protein